MKKTKTMTIDEHPQRTILETRDTDTFLTIENNNLNIHSDPWIKSDRDSIRNSCDVFVTVWIPTLCDVSISSWGKLAGGEAACLLRDGKEFHTGNTREAPMMEIQTWTIRSYIMLEYVLFVRASCFLASLFNFIRDSAGLVISLTQSFPVVKIMPRLHIWPWLQGWLNKIAYFWRIKYVEYALAYLMNFKYCTLMIKRW